MLLWEVDGKCGGPWRSSWVDMVREPVTRSHFEQGTVGRVDVSSNRETSGWRDGWVVKLLVQA